MEGSVQARPAQRNPSVVTRHSWRLPRRRRGHHSHPWRRYSASLLCLHSLRHGRRALLFRGTTCTVTSCPIVVPLLLPRTVLLCNHSCSPRSVVWDSSWLWQRRWRPWRTCCSLHAAPVPAPTARGLRASTREVGRAPLSLQANL